MLRVLHYLLNIHSEALLSLQILFRLVPHVLYIALQPVNNDVFPPLLIPLDSLRLSFNIHLSASHGGISSHETKVGTLLT